MASNEKGYFKIRDEVAARAYRKTITTFVVPSEYCSSAFKPARTTPLKVQMNYKVHQSYCG